VSWRLFTVSLVKDLRRRLADPLALVLWFGIPLLVASLLGLVSAGGQGPRGRLLLADADEGLVGLVIAGAVRQQPLSTFFALERVAEAEGRAEVAAGRASALVIVPAGATGAILDGRPVTLALVTNPSQRILPAIVQQGLEMLVEAAFYLQRLGGDALALVRDGQRTEGFLDDDRIARASVDLNQRLRRLARVLFPPVLALAPKPAAGEGSPGAAAGALDIGRLLLPGVLFMALLFVAQGTSDDIWDEQRQGTLRRAMSAPGSVLAFLAAKLASGAAIAAGASLVALAAGIALFGVPPLRAAAAWPWCVFGGVVLLCLFQVPQLVATTRQGAGLLSNLIVFPLMMIGGSFFPFEMMPAWMARIGRWTPNGQAVARLKELLAGTADPAALAVAVVAMGVPAALALAVSARLVRRRFEVTW